MPRIQFRTNIDDAIKRVKLEQANLKLAIFKEEVAQELKAAEPQEHTPYAEIRPPNDEEMRIIQDRVNALYDKICTAHEEEKRQTLLSYADDWP